MPRLKWTWGEGALFAASAIFLVSVAQATDSPTLNTPPADGPLYGVPAKWQSWLEYPNSEGRVAVATTGDLPDVERHPFFLPIGTNGRACVTCHRPSDGMALSVQTVQREWERLGAKSPLFAAIDGSNCPSLPQGKAESHSILLERGAFRIAIPWPPREADGSPIDPEFTIRVVNDPTGCNTDPNYGLNSSDPHVSVYRRPRVAANFRYIVKPFHENNTKTKEPLGRDPETGKHVFPLMADARQPSLRMQMRNAATIHMAVEKALSDEQLKEIEDFEMRLYVAQTFSTKGGKLEGGPKALGALGMRDGQSQINGNDRDSGVFLTFDEWKPKPGAVVTPPAQFRASVARGNDLFMTKPMWISGVAGINDIRLGNPIKQTCGFCHNAQMTGHDNVPGWMDLGTVNFPNNPGAKDLPVFEITCKSTALPHPYLGRKIYTNDPGRALITGRCMDVGAIVMQQFRGMAARPPYFTNGSAKTIREVVDFYDRRFNMGMTEQERIDLVNFLSVL